VEYEIPLSGLQDKADCPPNTLFLGFSKIDIDDISDCVARLKKAWEKWL
jgi:GntR family transcriptional regulator/MocR family aminotransferase